MPAAQVVLLYTMQTYDELRDDLLKYFFMPHPQVRKRMEQVVKQPAIDREIIPLFQAYHGGLIMPAENAQTRINRDLAALQILEAIRLYAGAHDGQLPDRLGDITEVPIPLDPFRGEPFLYERTGEEHGCSEIAAQSHHASLLRDTVRPRGRETIETMFCRRACPP